MLHRFCRSREQQPGPQPVRSSAPEASTLVPSTILPDAARLYSQTSERVDAETTASPNPRPGPSGRRPRRRSSARSPRRWLARRTKRRIDPGLVTGALAILRYGGVGGNRAHDPRQPEHQEPGGFTEQFNCGGARADETLSLIRRGDRGVRKQSLYQRIDAMHRQLKTILARPNAHRQATCRAPTTC